MEGSAQVTGAPGKAPVSRPAVLWLGSLTLLIIAAVVPLAILAHHNPLANAGTGLVAIARRTCLALGSSERCSGDANSAPARAALMLRS